MSSPQQKNKEQLRQILIKEALFREKIILSSGKESDYYFDARRVTLSPAGACLTAQVILGMIKDEQVDAIGGPTLGADPLAGAIAALSYQTPKPINTFIVRKAPKPHGKQQQIEGPILKDKARVIVIDDVATTGKAFLESIQVLRQMNVEVVYALCIVDREEGAREALEKVNCRLVSIFKGSELLK